MGRPIFVETVIGAPIEELWCRTQDPSLHERWDLRFTSITYLPRSDPSEPQRFRYETRIGFGLRIAGEGESTGTVRADSGTRTSALRFWSDDPRSLIRAGSGYWQYVPVESGIRFLTWYDYDTRLGPLGRMVDRLLFRPLLGRATAWSFDALRLWLERGIDPSLSVMRSLIYAVCTWTLAAIWIFQGLVPKLMFPQSGELAILTGAGVPYAPTLLVGAGLGEILVGVAHVMPWTARHTLRITLLVLPLLLVVAALTSSQWLATPFNAPTLTVAMLALAVLALIQDRDQPRATRCRRKPSSA